MAAPTTTRMSLTIASHVKVHLARVEKHSLPYCAHGLMKLLFFKERKEDCFFSMTETEDEISLVLEPKELDQLPSDYIMSDRRVWVPVRVSEGELGFESTGIVSSLARPLSNAGIPIFYMSTFGTDYVMVEEENLEKAAEVLRESFDVMTS